jgi:hypothetical protein
MGALSAENWFVAGEGGFSGIQACQAGRTSTRRVRRGDWVKAHRLGATAFFGTVRCCRSSGERGSRAPRGHHRFGFFDAPKAPLRPSTPREARPGKATLRRWDSTRQRRCTGRASFLSSLSGNPTSRLAPRSLPIRVVGWPMAFWPASSASERRLLSQASSIQSGASALGDNLRNSRAPR